MLRAEPQTGVVVPDPATPNRPIEMTPAFFYASLTACAIACACALLSVAVVLRRWAFIGEGIGHAGFGGAGIAWLLAVIFPALNHPSAPYVSAIFFCTATALAIGWVSRSER